ncbi:hypothetical protein QCA50_000197 [Cerrena zonata]|uniref:DUF1742-domain-containing protein n=1 Tax=Cerrena zonata TaxID=2478898 RepID=A0AAW0GSE0_9APHY
MSFTNLYYKRAAGTPKACFVCYKPTTTVLATINTVDFIYTCDNHLTDPGFATRIGESSDGAAGGANKPALSPDEIAKVKEEWEERQKRKQEKEKKEKEQDKEKEKADSSSKEDKPKSVAPSQSTSSVSTPAPAPSPSHQKYSLHRDIFAIRQADHRKRRQAAQAKELLPRLPGAPRGGLPSN